MHACNYMVGEFRVDKNGVYPHLIVDSTGNAPFHVDSNNHAVPAGVHVRPFAAPNAAALNEWYFEHVDHVLRLVVSVEALEGLAGPRGSFWSLGDKADGVAFDAGAHLCRSDHRLRAGRALAGFGGIMAGDAGPAEAVAFEATERAMASTGK